MRRGIFRRARSDHARAVHARRLHRRRRRTPPASTLAAYAFGLLPFVLIRSAVATFFARGDTATPVKAALIAAAVNIAFKIVLMGPLAQVGSGAGDLDRRLDQSRSGGLVRASRRSHRASTTRLRQSVVKLAAAGVVLAGVLWLARCAGRAMCFAGWAALRDLATLAVLGVIGAVVYGGIVLALFGRRWLAAFRAETRALKQ